jgi:hypothetical protein
VFEEVLASVCTPSAAISPCWTLVAILLYSSKISSSASHGISPEHSVVRRIDGFQGNFDVPAYDHKVTGNYLRYAHFLSGFLQIDTRSGISAGCGERSDRKSREIAQGVCNIICQSESKKIEILRVACVLPMS